jgi:putative phage-type endonuclease
VPTKPTELHQRKSLIPGEIIMNTPAIIQLTQGSPEWHAYRLTHRNASESAAVLGLSPWTTPYQLWLIKTSRYCHETNVAMQRGTELEPAARVAYEAQTGLIMQPVVLEAGAYSASLDGMTLEGDLVLEIKCPMRGANSNLWLDVAAGQVPAYYLIQVQHQLMVSGASTAHLWVYDGNKGLLHEIDRDELAMDRIRQAWDAFQPYLDSDTPPPLSEADTLVRNDPAWADAAKAFSDAKRLADEQADRLELARKALVLLARHPKESGAGVSVTRFWKAGNVVYKDVPALKGVDLDKFRGKSREEVRVSVA